MPLNSVPGPCQHIQNTILQDQTKNAQSIADGHFWGEGMLGYGWGTIYELSNLPGRRAPVTSSIPSATLLTETSPNCSCLHFCMWRRVLHHEACMPDVNALFMVEHLCLKF